MARAAILMFGSLVAAQAFAAPFAKDGSATVTRNGSPSACRKAIASAKPAKPPPPIRTSARAAGALSGVLGLGGFVFGIGEVYHSIKAQNLMNTATTNTAVADLLSILDLETLEVNLFRGHSPQTGWQRVFGGQVIGQALVAATRTVEGSLPHSLHAYFLLAGDPKVPIVYEVDRIRDGKSFATRRVVAIQHGRAIYTMAVSFHRDEPGLSNQAPMPAVPSPDPAARNPVAWWPGRAAPVPPCRAGRRRTGAPSACGPGRTTTPARITLLPGLRPCGIAPAAVVAWARY